MGWDGGVCGGRLEAEVVVLVVLSRGLMPLVGAEVQGRAWCLSC